MTKEKTEKVLKELQEVRAEELKGETKTLFETIMAIADERDELKVRVKEQELEISLLKKTHNYDVKMIDDVKGKAVKLHNQLEEQEKLINELAISISNEDIDEEVCKHIKCVDNEEKMNCVECVKNFFINKIKQEEEIKKNEY